MVPVQKNKGFCITNSQKLAMIESPPTTPMLNPYSQSNKRVEHQLFIPLYRLLQLRNRHSFMIAVGSGDTKTDALGGQDKPNIGVKKTYEPGPYRYFL